MAEQWHKVGKKDMPSAEEEVLVVSEGVVQIAIWSAEDHAWYDAFNLLDELENVTHWMPLPALPAEVNESLVAHGVGELPIIMRGKFDEEVKGGENAG